MRSIPLFTKRLIKWGSLFVGAIAGAILLSHLLNPSASQFIDAYSSPASSSVPQAASPNVSPTPSSLSQLQVQTKYDRALVHYATVSRSDGSFRQMYLDAQNLSQIQPGQPLPDGTMILMESWHRPDGLGTVFIKQKQNGNWLYGSFSPEQPNYQFSDRGSCRGCHLPFSQTDFTLTKPLLEAALQSRSVQTATCNLPGRTPCAPEAYLPQGT